MSWDNVGPNQCHMDGTPIVKPRPSGEKPKMAKYDHGGGCPCGLYRECIPQCMHNVEERTRQENEAKYTRRIIGMKDPGDFGFTIVGEEDLQSPDDTRAEQLRELIMPLLNNLKANPDKDIIRWKGAERVKKIDEFIKKMNDLVDG